MAGQRLSLRAQAVAWLAQREHSEHELRRKLLRRLKEDSAVAAQAAANPQAPSSTTIDADDAAMQVDAVISWLTERAYLDAQRFIDSRVHVRAGRYGLGRIQHELAQHRLALSPEVAGELRASEFERAQALWQRRFGTPAETARDAARQARFLAGRGFAGEVVRRVLRMATGMATEMATERATERATMVPPPANEAPARQEDDLAI